ncbi:LGFP repeat-containing protein [Leucobacter aridicollis]|uniref:LGFP repeat-containing protein n=1 Tax=Leucobacter aridicollis TaxID=283878 RepID=UPI002104F215|nr:hypothetical protein [Leucobacter aridicollis]UTX52784.1 hypothetical protein KI794_13845 [Leucobacter aridicollis]
MNSSARNAILALVAMVALLLPNASAAPAEAAPVTGFEAGNIISDTLFYDGNAMTAAQVQTFLNKRVPECWLGRPGYEVGKQVMWGGPTTLASKCTKDYVAKTQTRASNAYCAAYAGGGNETVAQIIAKVGKACGVSQQALLVMLEKEQGLITDPWPNNAQYSSAMGYACPDSGPGGTANCDPKKGGFFEQVYGAAWQLKVYEAFPNNYNYKPYATSFIRWDTEVSCGGKDVYLENRATAALYIYTPYQPNKASLDAGWGEGDECSSYGNRNFFNLFKAWFGTPNGQFEATGKILDYWTVHQQWLGKPTANAVTSNANGGGRSQQFAGGIVFEPRASGAKVSGMTKASPILAAFNKAGGVSGSWGWPLEAAANQGTSGNNVMRFQSGSVVESKASGVFLIPTVLVAAWNSSGGFSGSWGYPTAAAKPVGGANYQAFQKGTVGLGGDGKTFLVAHPFGPRWIEEGGVGHALGAPTGKVTSISANGGGKRLDFQRGSMFSSSHGVASLRAGALGDEYLRLGGPASAWGWPNGRYICNAAGTECSMSFSSGVGVWTNARGVVFTEGSAPASPGTKPGAGESVVGGTV